MNLVLLGAPGSGKGTQAKRLSSCYRVDKISLGDILRSEAHNQTELGNKVTNFMQQGLLVPDEIIKEVIDKNIENSGFVLDGFPRNLTQVCILEEILKEKSITIDKVIYIKVDQQAAVNRLSGRRVCRQCGDLYHLVTMAPKIPDTCDKCNAQLSQRDDYNEITVRKRWQVYMQETHGLIDYYKKKGILLEVDGDQEIDSVYQAIKNKVDNETKKEETLQM